MITSVTILSIFLKEKLKPRKVKSFIQGMKQEVVETCAANREKHGPEQQRKHPWQTIVL